jgi:hypothetical protein
VHDVVLQEHQLPGLVCPFYFLDYSVCFACWKREIPVPVIDNAPVDAGDAVIVREAFLGLIVGFIRILYLA